MNRPVSEPIEGLVEFADCATFTRELGAGSPVVVVHGGPGFSHDYLLPVLEPLYRRRRLIFFDQPGCGQTPAPDGALSIARCFEHMRAVLAHFAVRGSIGLIAHSWGSLVVAGALSKPLPAGRQLPAIGEGLLINPMPVSSKTYEAARRRLIERIPLSARLRAPLRALLTGNGASVMRVLMPYYMADPAALPADDFPLNLKTYRTLDAELKDFDHSTGLAHLNKLSIVRGSHEFASQDDIADLVAATSATQTIANAGHFPFWEAADEFEEVLKTAFV